MKVATSLAIASLATSALAAGAVHKGRHARFHEAKREAEILELHKRALDADPSLEKRCGEMINTMYNGNTPMSFPNCFGTCSSAPECGSGGAAPAASPAASPAAAAPVAAFAVAASSAPAATSPVVANTPASTPANKQQEPASTAAASTPAASTPASSSSSSSGSSSGSTGAIGLAYNDPSLITGSWLTGDAAWAYNWDYRSGDLNSKLTYVPMFHDPGALDGFKTASFPSGSHLLSLNEPDKTTAEGGCNLSPADACTAHNSAFSGKSGYQVSSPAVSSQDDASHGLAWLTSFQKACPSAQVDFVTLHWYGGGGAADVQAKAFLSYIDEAVSTVGKLYPNKKIWFTEFAATPITDANLNAEFLTAVLPSMKKNSAIERIAPFMVGTQGMLGSNTPSAAGKVLISI